MLRWRYTESGDVVLRGGASREPTLAPVPPAPKLKPVPPAPAPVGVATVEGDIALGPRARAMVSQLGETVLAPIAAALTIIPPATPPTSGPTRKPQDTQTGAAADNWFFVSKLAEFPGNFPPVDKLRSIGITGVMLEADDPLLEQGINEAHSNGLKAGIWADPHNYSPPESVVDDVAGKAKSLGADAAGLDVETIAKGAPGSDGYNLSAIIAARAQSELAGIPWMVTPVRSGGDFDFKAYVGAGGAVSVQAYGANPSTDLFDPVEVAKLALANGVPIDKLQVLLSPAQLTQATLDALHAIGVWNVSVYRQDGLDGVNVTIPFRRPQTRPLRRLLRRLRRRLRRRKRKPPTRSPS